MASPNALFSSAATADKSSVVFTSIKGMALLLYAGQRFPVNLTVFLAVNRRILLIVHLGGVVALVVPYIGATLGVCAAFAERGNKRIQENTRTATPMQAKPTLPGTFLNSLAASTFSRPLIFITGFISR
mgnify:CR=1 FL=1